MKHVKLFEQFVRSINEYSREDFTAKEIKGKDAIKPALFAKLMPRTSKFNEEASNRIVSFNGTAMATHVQYFVVRPHGNKPDRPTYRIHVEQYYKWRPGDPKVDVSRLYILKLKEGSDWREERRSEDHWDVLGATYVQTTQFLDELERVFEVLKRVS
jgi:hypothetical protein